MHRRLLEHDPRFPFLQPLLLFLLLFWALVPDLDAIPGLLADDLGRFHNNFTHSFAAALVFSTLPGMILSWITRHSFITWYTALCLSYASHILLDFVTYSERGLLLLWPFVVRRYESGLTLFYGVRWSEGLISYHHLMTLASELIFTGLVMIGFWVWRSRKLKKLRPDFREGDG